MSWVQFDERVWPATDHLAQINLHLSRESAGCARQSWSWELFHNIEVPGDDHGQPAETAGYISIVIENLYLDLTDWRQLGGREIRAIPAWHDAHEETNEYGNLELARVEVTATDLLRPGEGADRQVRRVEAAGIAHDFVLRFGQRDGWVFPCELDAWVIPRGDYYRTEPEPEAALARFGEGPPNLRVMAAAAIEHISAVVAPAEDPVPLARAALRKAIAFDEDSWTGRIEWQCRATADRKGYEAIAGSRSTVHFRARE